MTEERFPPLAPDAMTPEQSRVAAAIMDGPRGSIRGPFKALLRSPELADRVQKVGEYIRFQSCLPAHLNEMAIMLAGRKWKAQFEFYAHRELGLKAGLNPAIPAAIAVGQRPATMTADEAAVYEFSTELLGSGQVSDANFAAIAGLFGEAGVIDLIGAIGYYSLVSMVLNVDRYKLPEGVEPPLK
ncbi:carboxymuconolactone decarboxylase family protein [Acidisphaera sp. L21]|uniref:carboxymuconolactone decarboxylase family protein n=1 Tax=Acidisphaera sp. L21 TaxID=1641851 RepID=UPI00131B3EF6|nr:carboxymuconolactone decarboxylase family protein [Acidisphaera sp. L21]